MPTDLSLLVPEATVAEFCRRWNVAELALFGSVLRGEDRPGSDVDLLVTFAGGKRPTVEGRLNMVRELEALFGRPVDLVERRLVEESPNYIRRQAILSSAEVIYAA